MIMQLIRTFVALARMRCHSWNTNHTGGLGLFSREIPEFVMTEDEANLFWICVIIKHMQQK